MLEEKIKRRILFMEAVNSELKKLKEQLSPESPTGPEDQDPFSAMSVVSAFGKPLQNLTATFAWASKFLAAEVISTVSTVVQGALKGFYESPEVLRTFFDLRKDEKNKILADISNEYKSVLEDNMKSLLNNEDFMVALFLANPGIYLAEKLLGKGKKETKAMLKFIDNVTGRAVSAKLKEKWPGLENQFFNNLGSDDNDASAVSGPNAKTAKLNNPKQKMPTMQQVKQALKQDIELWNRFNNSKFIQSVQEKKATAGVKTPEQKQQEVNVLLENIKHIFEANTVEELQLALNNAGYTNVKVFDVAKTSKVDLQNETMKSAFIALMKDNFLATTVDTLTKLSKQPEADKDLIADLIQKLKELGGIIKRPSTPPAAKKQQPAPAPPQQQQTTHPPATPPTAATPTQSKKQ